MLNSKKLLVQAHIIPKLRLGNKLPEGGVEPTGPHKVKIINDVIQKGKNHKGQVIDVVRYTVEENGQQKVYDVPVKDNNGELHYLVQRLSEVEEGQEVILEMKKQGIKNYVNITPVVHSSEIEVKDEDEIQIDEDLIDLVTGQYLGEQVL